MNFSFWLAGCAAVSGGLAAAPLKQTTFTQVVNQVEVLAAAAQPARAARMNDSFQAPEVLRTGPVSRAELTAADQTITRIGANSVFTFAENDRSLRLEHGNVLFHSPTGRGGGVIKTSGAAAAVLGTTLIVSATRDGGFKTIVLEGKGKVRLPNGDARQLRAGQLAFVLGGGQRFGPVLEINLGKLIAGSRLVNGFERPLPSQERIRREIERQEQKLAKGRARDTGLSVADYATEFEVGTVDQGEKERVFEFEGKIIERERIERLKRALRTDVAITAPTLPVDHLFLDKFDLVIEGLHFDDYHGFFGRDIEFRAAELNLGPFADLDLPFFDFLALGNLHLSQSLTFHASAALPLFLTAVERLDAAAGVTLSYDNPGGLYAVSRQSTAFADNHFENPAGLLWLQSSLGDLTLAGSTLAGQEVKLFAGQDLTLADSALQARLVKIENLPQAIPFDTGKGASQFAGLGIPTEATGDIRLERTAIRGEADANGALAIRSANLLGLTGVSLVNLATISLEARTLNLEQVDFPGGSAVTLRSELGLLAPNPNTGAASVPGHVNFISAVSYGGAPAEQAVGAGITITRLGATGPGR